MKFNGSLLVVNDIAKSRKFYETVLGQTVILDFGENIMFEGNFVIFSKSSWMKFTGKCQSDIMSGSHNFELCFEEENFMDFLSHLNAFKDIEYVHTALEYPWGQKVVRFYDPDRHIIEVGESMKSVLNRISMEEAERLSKKSKGPVTSLYESRMSDISRDEF